MAEESELFPFYKLPALVKWKILRQYVPVLYKATVLNVMHEFSMLFEHHESWLNPSETFFEIYRVLSSLEPGMYFSLKDYTSSGFRVSMDMENTTFSLYRLDRYPYPFRNSSSGWFPIHTESQNTISLKMMREFIIEFLKNHTTAERGGIIQYYPFDDYRHYFFVNRSANVVHWSDGKDHTIENNSCFIIDEYESYEITFNDDAVQLTRCILIFDRLINSNYLSKHDILEHCRVVQDSVQKLTPITDQLLSNGEGLFRDNIELCLKFRIIDDDFVSLDTKMRDRQLSLDYVDTNFSIKWLRKMIKEIPPIAWFR